ncbi:NAD-dependent epimerase/dehydratase family protein [Paenibacillus sp. CN-4]|uniref:polysaccharide biosynthesis C-terminal domain-containing protein n=1 Tax=Paenibacillus nanchangensis TaxID=3348343 RepID=UPI00397D68FE
MKILVTGANGFIGKNLVAQLNNLGYRDVVCFTKNHTLEDLEDFCENIDFVFHLAGINRPKSVDEFIEGNYSLTESLISGLQKHNNKCPILMTSSIQALQNNPYGNSKKAAEDVLLSHKQKTGSNVLIYRLPNVFGKWSRPNYNSVIATFAFNISRNLEININNPNTELELVYIDDVIEEFINALNGNHNSTNIYGEISSLHIKRLGHIAELLYSFKSSRTNKSVPDLSDPFVKKLYSTYLSFLPQDEFIYDLHMNIDERGSFTEFIKTTDRGQISINISKPGIVKGNHWHHTKNEKFLVVSGEGIIRFRDYGTKNIIEYRVSGEKLQVLDIPTGYTHNIENIGDQDMVTVMWANEAFDPEKPDTYFMEVQPR